MTCPAHLAQAGKAFYETVTTEFEEFDPQEDQILIAACEQLDVIAQCRNRLRREGNFIVTRPHMNQVAHPAIAVQRQAQKTFSTLVRQLDLPAPTEPSRNGKGKRAPYGSGRVSRARAAA
jgi:phage terminase small subunit